MSKIIAFMRAGEIAILSPAYCEPLQVMREVPGVQIIEHEATEREPARREVKEVAAIYTPESESEIRSRAAHVVLEAGTRFVELSDVPEEGSPEYAALLEAADGWEKVSMGREAFAQTWVSAAQAIQQAHDAQLTSARTAAAEWNQAAAVAWAAAREVEPEPGGEA